MEQKNKSTRTQNAAKTKNTILKAASNLFIKNGFEGTSMSEIAKKADLNQSLIYHYFKSKEELWKSVKNDFVEKHMEGISPKIDTDQNLKNYFEQIVYDRFDFFEKHPNVLRMIGWQKLESPKNKLAGGTIFSPDNWKGNFLRLQKLGEIQKKANIDMMILFITSVITGSFTEDFSNKLHNKKFKEDYLSMMVNSFILLFGAK